MAGFAGRNTCGVVHGVVSGLLCLNWRGSHRLVAICIGSTVGAGRRTVGKVSRLMALPGQFTMRHVQPPTWAGASGGLSGDYPGCQVVGQFLDQMHRAMPPARTPNRDRCVFLALLEEPRQEHV